MSLHAAIPSWMIFVFVMVFIGPVMRFVFGGRRRWELLQQSGGGRLRRQEIERLEAAITERDAVIEDLQHRLSEMESRLDFTERLIASKTSVPT